MERPKKDGRIATDIQRKKGYLYIVIKDNEKLNESKWVSTGLTDTPKNIKKAIDVHTGSAVENKYLKR